MRNIYFTAFNGYLIRKNTTKYSKSQQTTEAERDTFCILTVKAPNPHSFAMESVKICHFRTLRAGDFSLRIFCCFCLHYIHVKKFVFEDISVEYEFKSVKFKGVREPCFRLDISVYMLKCV